MEAVDVEAHSVRDVGLADCTEQGAEMHQPVDALVHDQLLQFLQVEHVRIDERSCTRNSTPPPTVPTGTYAMGSWPQWLHDSPLTVL